MNVQEEYAALTERLAVLNHKHAVLVAKEEQKAGERKRLEEELTAAGVDVAHLDAEASRLEAEVLLAYQKAKGSVDEFEAQLTQVAGNGQVTKTPPVADPVREYRRDLTPPPPPPDDLDI